MKPRRSPTPDDLNDAPELAILAALHGILELAPRALASEYPQLGDSECPRWARHTTPRSEAADRILDAARPLAKALKAYRRTVAIERDHRDDADRTF
jgi:hypothetical protein